MSDCKKLSLRRPAPAVVRALCGVGFHSYSFSRDQLSLVDRGWTVAIAHIRGGGDMGRKWYEVCYYHTRASSWRPVTSPGGSGCWSNAKERLQSSSFSCVMLTAIQRESCCAISCTHKRGCAVLCCAALVKWEV